MSKVGVGEREREEDDEDEEDIVRKEIILFIVLLIQYSVSCYSFYSITFFLILFYSMTLRRSKRRTVKPRTQPVVSPPPPATKDAQDYQEYKELGVCLLCIVLVSWYVYATEVPTYLTEPTHFTLSGVQQCIASPARCEVFGMKSRAWMFHYCLYRECRYDFVREDCLVWWNYFADWPNQAQRDMVVTCPILYIALGGDWTDEKLCEMCGVRTNGEQCKDADDSNNDSNALPVPV